VTPPGPHGLVLRSGDVFFRFRSYWPLLLVPLVVGAIAGFHDRFASHGADLAWEAGCVLVALLGLAVRVYTVGVAAPGTSGRNTRRQKAARLNTTGPYSVVRHPLYLGNAVIAVGFALFPHAWPAPPLVAALAVGYYACIAVREEQFLRERFGAAFEAWAARVPRFVPSPGGWVPADRAFAPKAVLRAEYHALALILVAPMVLDIVEDLDEVGRLVLDPVWTVAAAAGVAQFVALRWLKKRTRVLAPGPPGRA
jgi:protein-S-isoprenylcysteine O-methyltransferase Ste14